MLAKTTRAVAITCKSKNSDRGKKLTRCGLFLRGRKIDFQQTSSPDRPCCLSVPIQIAPNLSSAFMKASCFVWTDVKSFSILISEPTTVDQVAKSSFSGFVTIVLVAGPWFSAKGRNYRASSGPRPKGRLLVEAHIFVRQGASTTV